MSNMSYLLPEGPKHGSFSDGWFAKWFVNLDEKRLRPFLIRNYSVENIIFQDAFNEMINEKFDDNNPAEV